MIAPGEIHEVGELGEAQGWMVQFSADAIEPGGDLAYGYAGAGLLYGGNETGRGDKLLGGADRVPLLGLEGSHPPEPTRALRRGAAPDFRLRYPVRS